MKEGSTQSKVNVGKVSSEVKLDAKNPIPLDYGFTSSYTTNGTKYIPFLHPNDNFFNTLLELRLLSPTQFACIGTKTNYVVGKGLYIDGVAVSEKPSEVKDVEVKKIIEFCKYVNNRKQNINQVIRKVVDSYLTFGNIPIEIVRLSIKGKKFVYAYPKNMLDCRFTEENENGEPENVVISKTFRRGSNGTFFYNEKEAKVIPIYKRGPGDKSKYWLKDGKVERTIIWLKNEVAGYDHYGMPSSVASIHEQKTEYEVTRFNNDLLENNMVIGGSVFLTGALSETETNKIASAIIKRHTGKGKQGRVNVFASEGGITDAKWVPYDTQKEGSYDKLDTKAMNKIILANEWDAVLCGIPVEGGLGKGAGYMQEVYDQKLETVIIPLQSIILDEFISVFFEIVDEWCGTKFSSYKMEIKPTQISNNTKQLISTPQGLEAFIKIVNLVASGAYSIEAAIKLVAARFGISEQEAKDQLGTINVRKDKSNTPGANQPAGGNK